MQNSIFLKDLKFIVFKIRKKFTSLLGSRKKGSTISGLDALSSIFVVPDFCTAKLVNRVLRDSHDVVNLR